MARWTWTGWMVAAGLLLGCSGDNTTGTTDTSEQDVDVLMPDLVPVDLTDDTGAPDTAPEVVEPPKPGEFGYACDEALDCNSGWCIQTADGRQCTRECSESCPPGYDCRLAPGTDAITVCLPRFLNLCDPCRETTECNQPGTSGNYCLSYAEKGRFCGVACNADPDCPGGYVCRNVPVGGGAEARQCVPADGAECKCSPFAKQLQKPTTCFVENANGKCEGTRFCLQSGLSSCDAATPFPESCNKLDDNCNGVTDEFPPDYVCEITNDIGTCPGQGTCIDGVESCNGNPPRLDNNCDGIDDDCDGETDEEACNDGNDCTRDSCSTGAGGELICNHVNDNTRLCNDGSVCTQVDKCQDGQCIGFNPLSCEDGNACTTNICDPVVGCLTSFNSNPCEDGNPCTINDACNQGVCVAGGPNRCDDNNECTQDSCQPGVGCTNTNLSNGSACTLAGTGQCRTGQCQNGACRAVNLQDGTGCIASSSKCPTGKCTGGTCLSQSGIPCTTTYGIDLCQSVNVTGTCTGSGECNVNQAPPGFTCPGCPGICIQCFIQICIPF